MFIFFGWGTQTVKLIGVAFKHLCPNCNNEEYWTLKRIITWFTLFFIPVIPYSIQYFLFCPICERGIYLEGDELRNIKLVAEVNQLLIDGKISAEEHAMRLGAPIESEAVLSEQDKIEPILIENHQPESNPKFCTECGNALSVDSIFCGVCGVKINKK